MLWSHGGLGETHFNRYDVMEETVTNGFWIEAVRAAGFVRDDNFYNLLETAKFNRRLKVAIRKPEIIRKVWRRVKRREGLKIVKITSITRLGWITP